MRMRFLMGLARFLHLVALAVAALILVLPGLQAIATLRRPAVVLAAASMVLVLHKLGAAEGLELSTELASTLVPQQ